MIKFLIVTVLIILFFRLVAPTLFRWLLTMFIKKKMRNGGFFYSNMQQPQNQNHNSQHNHVKPDGKVKIDYIPEQPDRKNFDGGEYVEYEEVK